MPKAARTRASSSIHQPSAKPAKRQFAVQENAVEHVQVGQDAEKSAADILDAMNEPGAEAESRHTLKKKEKMQMKREAFVQRLETAQSPYSKSHNRRLKRKAKEQVAGGLDEIHLAIEALGQDNTPTQTIGEQGDDIGYPGSTPSDGTKSRPKPGLIGEGKKEPLSKSQRKRALQLEKLRHPLILSNPDFSANPFETIRKHAKNTLVKHEVLS